MTEDALLSSESVLEAIVGTGKVSSCFEHNAKLGPKPRTQL